MEELARLQASCKAFKGHITRLHSKAQVDKKIATLIDDASELESALYNAEEFQDDIVDRIARATRYIELCSIKPSQQSQTPPRATSQSDLHQLEGDHTSTVHEVSLVTAPSVVASGSTSTASIPVTLEPVSAITTSSVTLPTNTAAPLPPVSLANSVAEACSTQ